MNNANLYRVQQIRHIEQLAYEQYGYEPATLMEQAGLAAFQALLRFWPSAQQLIVFCGHGNNGGDGYTLARLAQNHGLQVTVYAVGDPTRFSEVTQQAYQHCLAAGIAITAYTDQDITAADVVIDALLGIGIHGQVHGDYLSAITAINKAQRPTLSLDIPSGLYADTGQTAGDAVHAEVTVTFIGIKKGLVTGQAKDFTGKLICDDLGLPQDLLARAEVDAQIISHDVLRKMLPKRSRCANKGDFGHVLALGGNHGMVGAVRMASEAAARVGAGLVSIGTRADHASFISMMRPELMCHSVEIASDLLPLLAKATVLVLGPGLGKDAWADTIFTEALNNSLPKVVDADALNRLAQTPSHRQDWILTPHPGEAARLLACSSAEIEADRFAAIAALQQRYGGVIVLKGAGTLIRGEQGLTYVCTAGNPGMASGGMGDVLSGILGGLLAQGLSLLAAAQTGVLIHALAADVVAQTQGERGMLASDLFPVLPQIVN